jgi:hypothetical protein
MKNIFKPEDFTLNGEPIDSIKITPFFAAKQANEKLQNFFDQLPDMYGTVTSDKEIFLSLDRRNGSSVICKLIAKESITTAFSILDGKK